MTISELRLALDLGFDHKANVLKQHAIMMSNKRYLFVDSSNGKCYLFDVNGNEDDIAKLDYLDDMLFYKDSYLKLIVIPDSVTSIGNSTFCGCTNLTSVTIPNSVTSIRRYAFYLCSGLTSVTIPNSVTSIGSWAFHNCRGLKNITISNNVISIGNYVFNGCPNLQDIIFKGKSIDEVKAMKYYPWGIKDVSVIKCES